MGGELEAVLQPPFRSIVQISLPSYTNKLIHKPVRRVCIRCQERKIAFGSFLENKLV